MDGPRLVLDVVRLVLHGWAIALAYLVAGALACLPVVGIPFGVASSELAAVGPFPLGKRVVETHAPRSWFATGGAVAAPR